MKRFAHEVLLDSQPLALLFASFSAQTGALKACQGKGIQHECWTSHKTIVTVHRIQNLRNEILERHIATQYGVGQGHGHPHDGKFPNGLTRHMTCGQSESIRIGANPCQDLQTVIVAE